MKEIEIQTSLYILLAIYLFFLFLNFLKEFVLDEHFIFENGKTKYRYRIRPKDFDFVDFFIKGRSNFFYHNRSGNGFVFTTLFQLSFSALVTDLLIFLSMVYLNQFDAFKIQIEVSPIYLATFTLAIFGSIFWNEREGYYKKWEYMAQSYKDYKFADKENDLQKLRYIDFLHDLQLMNMFGHQTYNEIFSKFLFSMGELKDLPHTQPINHCRIEELIEEFQEKYTMVNTHENLFKEKKDD